ncbi:hypothetical protein K504DRAFT_456584 [Pleomassaria siparia CBS 279.74]|uniref:Pentatricopeptide repeat domain-containing protein n=1 Tax=Pleomassaria siparia CBS 279.74 TaxID=1314801 RepID=A0A6G1KN81_9PLEO|nr:hypothetical protein K504DRAFT_456584 [Pleomassaria siparia CBS 279.74]
MPTALDRLLASPSALRALRAIVNASELPTSTFPTVHCCPSTAHRRRYSSKRESQGSGGQTGIVNIPRRVRTRYNFKIRAWDEATNVDVPIQKNTPWLRIDIAQEGEKAGLYARALQYRERVDGHDGIRDIWFDMARRGFKLPTEDTSDARLLWATMIKSTQLVTPVIDHAVQLYKDTGQIFPHLYEVCMTYWLPRNPKLAQEHHHRMLVKLRLKKLPLLQLARLLKTVLTPKSLEVFMDIYRTSNERDLYDEIVPYLCDSGRVLDARRWHMLCTHRRDLPSPSLECHPLVRFFTAETTVISTPEHRFVYPSAGSTSRNGISRYNEDLQRRLLGRDIAPVRFEDAFCARMFATRAFLPESIIQGLAMVGVNEIGPQAVLAMCTKTLPLTDLPDRFKELRAAGITLQGCVFSLAVEKFALQGKFDLVRSMINSDQHPDVFNDTELQHKLLNFYLQEKDHAQAYRTLAVLTLFHNDPSTESWNLLFQASIRQLNPARMVQILQEMRTNQVLVTIESMKLIPSILRRRQLGRKPGRSPRGRFDDLRFVTRTYLTILEAGLSHMPPHSWKEILRRYGMLGRFRELRRLIFWLLCWYAPRNDAKFASLPKPVFLDSATEKLRAAFPQWRPPSDQVFVPDRHPHHPIGTLFTNSFQQGLIVWGFRAGLLPNASLEQSMLSETTSKKHYRARFLARGEIKRLDWSIGLRTLVQLRDYGVHVHRHTVTKALQMMFITLFGRGRSLRKENRAMEDHNTISYGTYVRKVNEVWGSPLFREPELLLAEDRLYGAAWQPRLRRRIRRRKWLGISDILGKNWRRSEAEMDQDGENEDWDRDTALITPVDVGVGVDVDVGMDTLKDNLTPRSKTRPVQVVKPPATTPVY